MKIYVKNVQGMNSLGKKHVELNNARKFDISFLVETKLTVDARQGIRGKWRYREGVFLSGAQGARRGVLTLFAERIAIQHLEDAADGEGQFCVNVFV